MLWALIRNLTFRLADANRMNEERWQQLNIHRSLKPEEIERPRRKSSKSSTGHAKNDECHPI